MKLLRALSSASLLAQDNSNPTSNAVITHQSDHAKLRGLAEGDPITLRCFDDCLDKKLTYEECKAHIEDILGDDLAKHEIPDLKIKIGAPRTPAELAKSYWFFTMFTNIDGEVDCNIDGGKVFYPFDWVTEKGTFKLPKVKCGGLNANQCCDKIFETLEEKDIPTTDVNGNCLSCWAKQEPLEPFILNDGSVGYIEHKFGPDYKCIESLVTIDEIKAKDADTKAALVELEKHLGGLLSRGATCIQLEEIQRDLRLKARLLPNAEAYIADFLCGLCEDGVEKYYPLPEDLKYKLTKIKKLIAKPINSDEHCIVIFTNKYNKVIEPPKIGGSRAGLDYDLDDPECDQTPPDEDELPRAKPHH